jgi:hypothetical protein
MKRACLGAVVLGAALISGSAFAQEIPVPAWSAADGAQDVVVLKDGGAVRGLVMEVLPNDHVTVKLADGRTATIVWSVIHHIEQAPHTQTTTPAETPAPVVAAPVKPSTASAPPTVLTGSVHVRMEGDNDAVLEQDHGGAWAVVCSATCDRDLPLEPQYRINGNGVRTSGAFKLQGKPGDQITLHLNTASSGGFSGGVTMALLGGLTATVGFWGMYAALLSENSYDYGNGYGSSNDHSGTVAAFGITTLVGAAIGTIGLVMAVSNEKTKIVQSAGTSEKGASLLLAPRTAPKMAALTPERQPTWLNLRPAGVSEAPTSTLFQLKF